MSAVIVPERPDTAGAMALIDELAGLLATLFN
jgi:hypothetical protein